MSSRIRTAFIALALGAVANVQAASPAKAAKPAPVPAAPTEVALSHQFSKASEERLARVVGRFNAQQHEAKVTLVRLESGERPAPMNLVRRQDMGEFLVHKSAFRPLFKVMEEAKVKLPGAVMPDLKAGVSDEKGNLFGLPVAYSTPVLFYNKNAFRKAGLDPEKPPKTWWEMQQVAGKLSDAGNACPYTSSWPTWIHVDNLSAVSGVPVASAKGELAFNSLPQVKHIAMLASWSKARYFHLFGRKAEADRHFLKGECAMITTDSWAHAEFREAQGVELGIAPLPYHDDVYGGRQHTLADGASLWVGGGYKPQEYKAVARFVAYLMTPEVQADLSEAYGQLPMTAAARSLLRGKAPRDLEQTLEVAYASLKGEGATHPLRLSAVDPVRIIIESELEAVWADQKPAKAALDTAVNLGNAVLSAKPALKRALPF